MRCLLPKIEGLWLDPRAWSVPNEKIEYAQRRRLRRKINSTSKSEVFPTWAPLPNPKEMKTSLSKVQAFKFILQHAASKLRFFQTSIFKFYLLSPISALLLPTCSTSSFQKLVEKVRKYIKEVWLIFKNRQRSGVASQQRLRPRLFDNTVKRVPKLRFEPVSFLFWVCL